MTPTELGEDPTVYESSTPFTDWGIGATCRPYAAKNLKIAHPPNRSEYRSLRFRAMLVNVRSPERTRPRTVWN